jgi:hypothetical protein
MLAQIYYQELDDHDSAPDFEQATLSKYEALVDGGSVDEWQVEELFEREIDTFEFDESCIAYVAVWVSADTFVGVFKIHCEYVKRFHADLQDRP